MKILVYLIAFFLLLYGAYMIHKVYRSLKTGAFRNGAIARKRNDPFWYWAQIVAWSLMAVFVIWGGLSLMLPDYIPPPHIPCSPKVPGDCGR